MKVIAVEEHFTSQLMKERATPSARHGDVIRDGLAIYGHDISIEAYDIGERRIQHMDAAGVDMQILSHNAPGAQAFQAKESIEIALDANERLYEAVQKHPTRFAGLASIPTIAPAEAVKELERTVTKLGFKGVMINGRNQEGFLDDKKYWPIFEAAEALDTVVYLHPREPHPDVYKTYFADYREASGAAWGYAVDTGSHFLRLVYGGVFDAFPKLKFVLGHLGEGLPFWLPRLNEHSKGPAGRRGLKKEPGQYITENLLVSTSGHFSDPAFHCTMMTLGIDNIMFAIDWPYESNKQGMEWLKRLQISPTDKAKLSHGNAERIFKL